MERLIRLPEVLAATGLARSTVYLRVTAGTFPAPMALADARVSVWRESEVEAWIAAQIAKANAADVIAKRAARSEHGAELRRARAEKEARVRAEATAAVTP